MLSCPHARAILNHEIRTQETEEVVLPSLSGGIKGEAGFWSPEVLFWAFGATFNSAVMPTYLGLLAVWFFIFYFFPSLHGT